MDDQAKSIAKLAHPLRVNIYVVYQPTMLVPELFW